MSRKLKIALNAYRIVSNSIENSIIAGYRKAFKHSENPPPDFPDEQTIADHIHNYIMNDLSEIIDWDKSGGK